MVISYSWKLSKKTLVNLNFIREIMKFQIGKSGNQTRGFMFKTDRAPIAPGPASDVELVPAKI